MLSQVTFKHQMLVVDSLVSESILGLDLLQKNQCIIDLLLQLMEWVEQQEKEQSKVKVQLIDNVCIPARSEQEVLARTQPALILAL